MPPKQLSLMDKLRKARKDAKKDKEPKKGKGPKQITDPRQVRRKIQEDKNIKLFFKELLETTTDPEDISKSVYNFSNDPKAPWGRSTILKEIFDILPSNLYVDFMNSFIDQDIDMLPEFWNSYRSKSSIIEAIRRKDEDLTAGDIERERLRKLNQQLYGDQEGKPIMEEPDYVVGDKFGGQRSGRDKEEIDALLEEAGGIRKLEKPRVKRYGSVKLLDGDEIKDVPEQKKRKVVTTYTFIDQNCINELNSAPWLNARVEGIFITPADKSTNINSYISQGKNKETLEHNGETWSKVSIGFYQLMCNMFKNRQEQDGDVFTAWKSSTEPVRFKIAYKTNSGFMVQDEEMFNKQKEYSKEQKTSDKEKLEKLLKEPVIPELQKFGKETLSLALQRIAPDIYDYSVNSAYIQKAIDTIKEQTETSKQFIDMLANTVFYLEESNAIIFKERIIREYYLPEILVTLSPSEKYPEALENQKQEFVDKNYKLMRRIIDKISENLANQYYNIMFPSNKIKQIETLYSGITDKIIIGSIKGNCGNNKKTKDSIEKAENYEIVYYEENGKTYCLLIDDLLNQISNVNDFSDVKNPETGKIIREDFIKRFVALYDNTIKDKGYEERIIEEEKEPEKQEEIPKEDELAPGLVDIMLENIRKCQVETLEWGDSDDENIPEKCTSIVDDDEDLESVDTPASDISSVSSSSSYSTDYDKSSNFSSDDDDDDDDNDNPKCRTCNGNCLVQLRTILQDSKGKFHPVHFCSIKCFEEERFPEKPKSSEGQFAAREARKAAKSSSSKNKQ